MTTQPSHADLMTRMDREREEREAFRLEVRDALKELADAVRAIGEDLEGIELKLGEEPDSDGKGGRGLIGDVRKTARDVQGLVDLKNKGMGAVAAVTLFGGLIVGGIAYWIQHAVKKVALIAWGWA